MNGFIAKTVTAAGFAAGLLGMGSGCHYYDLVDPCYPQRYEYAARVEVNDAFSPQVHNGHVLDQTVWNYEFEPGTARLTRGGEEHLAYLARRRPTPDPTVYLQVAQDIIYDPKAPDKYAEARTKLDTERAQAIQTYLGAKTSGRNLTFNVVMHDPAEVGISAVTAGQSAAIMQRSSQGILVRPGVGAGAGGGAAR
jgi:hypothetical protein